MPMLRWSTTLRALQERFPPQGEIALTGHAHIDLAWLWPYAETRRKARRTFHTALSLMEGGNEYLANSGFIFNQSTAQYYAQIEEDDPALFERIRAKVASGSWETVGGLWVEPDTNMPTGESLARQVLYGQRYFEQKFGTRHTVCWLPDCFGFSGALPQILKQGGITSFFTIKVNWNENNKFPVDLFWWEGLDGSRVLAHTFENPWHGYNGAVNPECLFMTWKNFKQKAVHPESLLAVGYGDGGGGVTPEYVEREMQLRDFPALPKARWSRVEDFFARAHETAEDATLPVWQNDIYLELHRATLTTQSAVKKLHRQAERALITAETVGSLAALLGRRPAAEPRGDLARRAQERVPRHPAGVVDRRGLRGRRARAERCDRSRQGGAEGGARADRRGAAEGHDRECSGGGEPVAVAAPDGQRRRDPAARHRCVRERGRRAGRACDRLGRRRRHADDREQASAGGHRQGRHDREPRPQGDGPRGAGGRGNQLWVYPGDKTRNWDAWDLEDDYARSGIELTAVESRSSSSDRRATMSGSGSCGGSASRR